MSGRSVGALEQLVARLCCGVPDCAERTLCTVVGRYWSLPVRLVRSTRFASPYARLCRNRGAAMKLSCHHDRYAICHRCKVILASPEELAVMDASRRPVAVVEGERRWGV